MYLCGHDYYWIRSKTFAVTSSSLTVLGSLHWIFSENASVSVVPWTSFLSLEMPDSIYFEIITMIHLCRGYKIPCSQISTRKTKNVEHMTCLLNRRELHACSMLRKLGVDVVNSLEIGAFCRAWPHLNTPDYCVYSIFLHRTPLSWVLLLSQ